MSACHFSLRLALLGARATGPSRLQFGTLNHGRRAAINRGPVCPEFPDNRTLHGHHQATRMTRSGRDGTAYSIISSARARIDGGMVKPIALAVFSFMTSSHLIGC